MGEEIRGDMMGEYNSSVYNSTAAYTEEHLRYKKTHFFWWRLSGDGNPYCMRPILPPYQRVMQKKKRRRTREGRGKKEKGKEPVVCPFLLRFSTLPPRANASANALPERGFATILPVSHHTGCAGGYVDGGRVLCKGQCWGSPWPVLGERV